MKKQLYSFGLFVAMTFSLFPSMSFATPMESWSPLDHIIQLSLTDIGTTTNRPRNPIEIPQVAQVGHSLYFFDGIDLFVNLYEVDETGVDC